MRIICKTILKKIYINLYTRLVELRISHQNTIYVVFLLKLYKYNDNKVGILYLEWILKTKDFCVF